MAAAREATRLSLFRRGPSRKDAEVALERARGLVEILSLSRADLAAANRILQEGETLLSAGETTRAIAMAETAERIANALEAEYREVTESAAKLREQRDELQRMGLSVVDEEAALKAARDQAEATRDFEGHPIPDYAGARALAEAAWSRAVAKRALADQAADAVFAAELAVGGVSDSFPGGTETLLEATQLLEKARAESAAGNFELAATDAALAEKIALAVMDQRRRAGETLRSVVNLLAELKSVGVPIVPITKSLEMGRILLEKGKLVAAVDVFNEAAQEAVQLGATYRQLLAAISAAEEAVESARSEGLPSADAESTLARARAAMRAGNYALAQACAEDVHLAIRRQRELRDGLKASLEETKAQIADLRDLGLAYVNDVEEMLAKAEEEFMNGDYAASGEDLRIATLLMKPSGNGKVRNGSAAQ